MTIYYINGLLFCYLFIYLFGAKKADRFTVVIESLQGLLRKGFECTFYIQVVKVNLHSKKVVHIILFIFLPFLLFFLDCRTHMRDFKPDACLLWCVEDE